jgi:hypothetical protein
LSRLSGVFIDIGAARVVPRCTEPAFEPLTVSVLEFVEVLLRTSFRAILRSALAVSRHPYRGLVVDSWSEAIRVHDADVKLGGYRMPWPRPDMDKRGR